MALTMASYEAYNWIATMSRAFLGYLSMYVVSKLVDYLVTNAREPHLSSFDIYIDIS